MKFKVMLLAGLLYSGLLSAQTLKPEDIYQRLLPSVMTLQVENGQGEKFIGTAFLALSDGIAVTSWHVVCDAVKVSAKLSDGRMVEVRGLVDKDEKHDLALVRVDVSGRPQVRLRSAAPAIGSRAYAIGAPKGFDFSITDGLISQIQSVDGYDQFQVSCPISGGNSGGPVLDDQGRVLGVTSWTKRDAQNLSFAIPARFLAGLNPRLRPVPWNRSSNPPPDPGRVRERHGVAGPATSAKNDAAELKQVLKESAGKRITLVVHDQGAEKSYTLVVPKNLAD